MTGGVLGLDPARIARRPVQGKEGLIVRATLAPIFCTVVVRLTTPDAPTTSGISDAEVSAPPPAVTPPAKGNSSAISGVPAIGQDIALRSNPPILRVLRPFYRGELRELPGTAVRRALPCITTVARGVDRGNPAFFVGMWVSQAGRRAALPGKLQCVPASQRPVVVEVARFLEESWRTLHSPFV